MSRLALLAALFAVGCSADSKPTTSPAKPADKMADKMKDDKMTDKMGDGKMGDGKMGTAPTPQDVTCRFWPPRPSSGGEGVRTPRPEADPCPASSPNTRSLVRLTHWVNGRWCCWS